MFSFHSQINLDTFLRCRRTCTHRNQTGRFTKDCAEWFKGMANVGMEGGSEGGIGRGCDAQHADGQYQHVGQYLEGTHRVAPRRGRRRGTQRAGGGRLHASWSHDIRGLLEGGGGIGRRHHSEDRRPPTKFAACLHRRIVRVGAARHATP